MNKNIEVIIKATKEIGGKIKTLSKERGAYEIIFNKKSFIFITKFSIKKSLTTPPVLTKYKDLTYKILKKDKIKTPKTAIINSQSSQEKISDTISKFKFPIVIKDAQGSESNGVFSNIKTPAEAFELISKIKKKYKYLIIQEKAKGKEYRVLILNGKVIAALEFIPPFITGNGKSTTLELIKKLQKNTSRKTSLDTYFMSLLKEQNETLNSIPSLDKKIFLRKNACLAEGGTSADVTDKINKNFSNILKKSLKSVGLNFGGIDVFCENLSKAEKSYQIIEINGKPDIYIHHFPTIGKSRNVAKLILNYIFNNEL